MRNEARRNGIIIGALLITIALMTVGYAALATQLTINGTASTGNAKWDISFLSITKNTTLSSTDAVENSTPTASGTAATFDVTLPKPGSKMVYDLVVQNIGTIDATFNEITGVDEINAQEPTQLTYKVERLDSEDGIAVTGTADLLNTTGKNYFRVTIEWPAGSTQTPTTTTSKTGTIYLDYVQKAS